MQVRVSLSPDRPDLAPLGRSPSQGGEEIFFWHKVLGKLIFSSWARVSLLSRLLFRELWLGAVEREIYKSFHLCVIYLNPGATFEKRLSALDPGLLFGQQTSLTELKKILDKFS